MIDWLPRAHGSYLLVIALDFAHLLVGDLLIGSVCEVVEQA